MLKPLCFDIDLIEEVMNMMKKNLTRLTAAIALLGTAPSLFATDLLDAFNQAFKSDPVFQQANETRLSSNIGVPIAFSALMPQFNTYAAIQRVQLTNRASIPLSSSTGAGSIGNLTGTSGITSAKEQTFTDGGYQLNLTQYLFNYSDWEQWKAARASSKAADATFTAALQSLMARTSQAYLAVLQAQDDLRYVEAEKKAIYQQLDQTSQEYKVGLVAITSVYQAQAAYDSIISQEIADQNTVINQRENLRVITGIYYNDLDGLKEHIPLVTPIPNDPNQWIKTAEQRNWSLLASRYNAQAAQETVFAQEGGHLPTVQAYAQRQYVKASSNMAQALDTSQNNEGVLLTLPVFQGGLVNAQTKQASYQYQSSLDQVEQTYRNVYNQTQQSYNNVVSGVSAVRADSQAIVSNASSLRSTIEAFRVGTETMLDVLTAQKNLFDAERQYSFDEYNYLNATISLKQAAGTLNYNDLMLINKMLIKSNENYSSLNIQSIQAQAQQDYNANIKQSSTIAASVGGIVPASPFTASPATVNTLPAKPSTVAAPPLPSSLPTTNVTPATTPVLPANTSTTPAKVTSVKAPAQPSNTSAMTTKKATDNIATNQTTVTKPASPTNPTKAPAAATSQSSQGKTTIPANTSSTNASNTVTKPVSVPS